jgi:hypothetical protein
MLKPGWSQRQYEKVKADLDQLPEWFKRSVMAQEAETTGKRVTRDEGSEKRDRRDVKKAGSRR